MKNEMSANLRTMIAETYDGGCWEPASAKIWDNSGTATQVWVFERDIEYHHKDWRCLIVTKETYSAESPDDVECSEDLLAIACPL